MPESGRSIVDEEQEGRVRLVLQPLDLGEDAIDLDAEPGGERETPRAGRSGVISPAAASILLILFLLPLLAFVKYYVVAASKDSYAGFLDYYYSRAVTVSPSGILYDIYNLLFNVASLALLIFVLFAMTNISAFGRFLSGRASVYGEPPRIAKLILGTRLRRNFFRLILVVGFGLFIVFNSIQIAGANISIQANASFTRRLMTLEPVLSAEEYKELDQRWATVRGKRDYDALMTRMDDISLIKHISIPDRLI